MKVLIDRTSDFLDVPSLAAMGRQLRSKTAYVICTSINEQADSSFLNAFQDTFSYLGIHYGGHLHANCADGYQPKRYEHDVQQFIALFAPNGDMTKDAQ